MTISNLMKMAKVLQMGRKTLWKKEKLLIMSNFSLSHSVFKRLVRQISKNPELVWGRVKSGSNDGILL